MSSTLEQYKPGDITYQRGILRLYVGTNEIPYLFVDSSDVTIHATTKAKSNNDLNLLVLKNKDEQVICTVFDLIEYAKTRGNK